MDTNFLKKEARTERLNFALTAEEKQKIMEITYRQRLKEKRFM